MKGQDHDPTGAPGRHDTGWWIAAAFFTFGVAFSVFGNIADAAPGPIARTIAVVPPLTLMGSLQVIERRRFRNKALGRAARGGLLVVALVAGAWSYQHLYGLLITHGESHLTAIIGPFAIDGLMLVCAAAMLEIDPGPAVKQSPAVKRSEAPSLNTPGQATPAPKRRPTTRKRTARKTRATPIPTPVELPEHVLQTAEELATELRARGESVNQRTIIPGMRAREIPLGNRKRAAVMQHLAERGLTSV